MNTRSTSSVAQSEPEEGPELAPMQVLFVPVTPLQALLPMAILFAPFAREFAPMATEFSPDAWAK